jgi:ribonuclease HI
MNTNKYLSVTYTNYRGETRQRTIEPKSVWFGSTEWHPEEQWLLKATDIEKGEERDFALKDITAIMSLASPEKPVDTTQKPGDVTEVKLFGDGGSRGNPGPSASGFVIMDMHDQILHEQGVYLGITTNNQAEYQALRLGLEQAKKMGVREVHAHMDSLLVINQMKGIFKVKNRDLWPIHEAIKLLVKDFAKVSFTHVPRELNKLADAEVNKCLDAQAN